jgi:hypothetical protein
VVAAEVECHIRLALHLLKVEIVDDASGTRGEKGGKKGVSWRRRVRRALFLS